MGGKVALVPLKLCQARACALSNGVGWESGMETDVHESCQPLPVTNATSDRMETEREGLRR